MGHGALASVAWVPEYIDRLGVSFATWGTIIGFSVIGSITPAAVCIQVVDALWFKASNSFCKLRGHGLFGRFGLDQ
jgi:hypothetical protein